MNITFDSVFKSDVNGTETYNNKVEPVIFVLEVIPETTTC